MKVCYYWINLDSAKNRYNNMLTQFKENNITNHVRVSAYPSINSTKRLKENACCRSHLQAVMHFLLNSNDPYALICEDDLTFELKQYWRKSVEEVINDAPSDWGIIQLATIIQNIQYKFNDKDTYFKWNDQRSSSCLAWVIHRECAKDLLNNYLNTRNIYQFATPDCWSSGIYIRVDKYTKYTSYTYKYPMFIYPDDNDSQLDNSLSLHTSCKRDIFRFLKSEESKPTEPKSTEPKPTEPKTPEPKTPEPKTPEPKTLEQNEKQIIVTSIPPKSGFGAHYLWKLCFLIHCRKNKYRYYNSSHEKSNILTIYSSEGIQIDNTIEYNKELNDFMGIVSDEIDKNEEIQLDTFNGLKVYKKEDVTDDILKELQEMYYNSPKPSYIDCDIAVHIRRGNVTEKKNSQRFAPLSYYINIIDSIIKDNYKNKTPKIIIFSVGDQKDFLELHKRYNNISIMLDTDLMEAFHTMVMSSHFIMGYSALSCCVGLLSKNTVYYTKSETWNRQCVPRLDHWIDATNINIYEVENIENTKEIKSVYTYKNHRLGFGAQYIGCICCFLYCRNNGYLYRHSEFNHIDKRMNPELDNIVNKEYTNDLNKFIGMYSDDIDDSISKINVNSWQFGLDKSCYKEEYLSELKKMYYSTENPTPIECDIAIHIRRGDVNVDKSTNRFQTVKYYKNILDNIVNEFKTPPKIVVFSQGNENDFIELKDYDNITFMLNTDIKEAFHSMVCAPIFIMGYSALSCCAALLSDNKIYYTTSKVWNTQCICCLDKWIKIGDQSNRKTLPN